MSNKLKILLSTVISVAVLVALAVVPVMAQVPVFSPFNGDVTVGGADAPVGTVIEAYMGVEGTPRATTTVVVAGEYEMLIQGAAGDVGQAVTFIVDGSVATTTPANPLFANYQPQVSTWLLVVEYSIP